MTDSFELATDIKVYQRSAPAVTDGYAASVVADGRIPMFRDGAHMTVDGSIDTGSHQLFLDYYNECQERIGERIVIPLYHFGIIAEIRAALDAAEADIRVNGRDRDALGDPALGRRFYDGQD